MSEITGNCYFIILLAKRTSISGDKRPEPVTYISRESPLAWSSYYHGNIGTADASREYSLFI